MYSTIYKSFFKHRKMKKKKKIKIQIVRLRDEEEEEEEGEKKKKKFETYKRLKLCLTTLNGFIKGKADGFLGSV